MAADGKHWNPEVELLAREELEALQLRRLKETLQR